ncbi:hypothetical protein KY339_05540 [Candidatus Woesearchaeota archaeon]|nr:hypothetical protein [Candidatus Woesearchaeota archaeon]
MKSKLLFIILIIILIAGCGKTTPTKLVTKGEAGSIATSYVIDDIGTEEPVTITQIYLKDNNWNVEMIVGDDKGTVIIDRKGNIIDVAEYEWVSESLDGKTIPKGYESAEYCNLDSDCVYQSNSCCGTEVNIYHHIETDNVGPTCHTQCVPLKFWDFYCNNNKCDRKVDCSNCEEISEFMESIGCFQERPSVTVSYACEHLSECDC